MKYKKELNFIRHRKREVEEQEKPSKYGMSFSWLDRKTDPIYLPKRKKFKR